MKIAFDAVPLVSEKITGIGWCEAGQTDAMARLYPENTYIYNFFESRGQTEKTERIQQFLKSGIEINKADFSGYLYRLVSNFLPVSYSRFFGGEYDITHFFNYIVPPKVKGKIVVTVHDMVYKAFPETVRARTKYMLDTGLRKSMKRADIIVTDSEFSKSEIIKYFPCYKDKIRVVPCGVDLKRFYPDNDIKRIEEVKKNLEIEGEYFLYLGTIEPRKNLQRLIEAYSRFIDNNDNLPKLVLAGGKGWLYNDIFEKVKKLNLDNKVIFTKYVPSGDMRYLMCGASAFLFPSIYEGFGMPPLEAMACGVPVLISGEASLPEVTGKSAVIVDAYSSDSIAQGIDKIYHDKNLRARLIKEGIERAKGFTWEKSAEILYNIYREIL
ncbi:MAG: glycosyltransferase family 4 protein [Oscillospiraceae bacterium]|nr:glycosyltransferase family 4 protein [Oscillospiraceae bacterium]